MSGRSAFGKFREELDTPVFVIEAGVAGLAVLAFALVEDAATETMNGINQFVTMSFYTGAAASGGAGVAEWVGGWTVFYWAWWFSWTPFVGLFIARISRGRTVRQVRLPPC